VVKWRRPEVRIEWGISEDGNPAHMQAWEPDRVPRIRPGQIIHVNVGIQNVGDLPGKDALTNFVVPDCLDLRKYQDLEALPRPSSNNFAGYPPDYKVLFFAAPVGIWTPSNWFTCHYQVSWKSDEEKRIPYEKRLPIQARLFFAVADPLFNASGRRSLPRLARSTKSIPPAPAGTPWPPPRPRGGFRPKVIRAEPYGRVFCELGERSDVRNVRLGG
jgi:hypothetical protein